MVAGVRTAGLAGGAGLKRGEAWAACKDPDVSDGSASIAGGVPVFVVLDLKKKLNTVICISNHSSKGKSEFFKSRYNQLEIYFRLNPNWHEGDAFISLLF